VADIFTQPVLAKLPGEIAIGHTRYSTAGDTVLLNAQPFSVACNKGKIAVAHNGNITNATELRAELGRNGAIFQASSDTEVILHLMAHSSERTLAAALRMRYCNWKAHFRWSSWPGPHYCGARSARIPAAGGGGDGNFGRPQMLRVRIGNMRVRPDWSGLPARRGAGRDGDCGTEGITRERWTPERDRAQCVFEHVYFSRPDSIVFGRSVEESREALGRLLAIEHPADADLVVPVPDSGVAAAIGYSDESGIPFRQALIRNHYVGRTFIEPSQAIRDFGVKLKLNPIRHLLQGRRVCW